jgi:hypothetical protein
MRNSKFIRRALLLAAFLATLFIVGCGSDSSLVSLPPPDGGVQPTPVASITLIASSNVLPSDGASSVTLSVLVRDSNNNLVGGVPIMFSADSGVLQVTPAAGDNDLPSAELFTAGDPTNRVITVSASIGSFSDSVSINVSGTQLELQGPDNVIQGDQVQFSARLRNSSGLGIAGTSVAIESAQGNGLSASTLLTNSQGEVLFTVTGTEGGDDTITVSAIGLTASAPLSVSADDSVVFVEPAAGAEIPLGVEQPVTVEWRVNGVPQTGTVNFSTTRGTLSELSAPLNSNGIATVNIRASTAGPATLTARVGTSGPLVQRSVEFVAVTPATIVAQASRFTVGPGEESTILATVRDAAGNPVKNKVVQFQIEDVTGGRLSVGTAVTGSAGTTQTVYTGGETISGSGEVIITAIVQEKPDLRSTVNLTVARREVDISIGTGNQLSAPNTASYQREFIVQVTDSQGVGIPKAVVQLSVRSKFYKKGFYVEDENNRWVAVGAFGAPLRCPDEDLNENGQLDADEDFNNSGSIEAGNVVSIAPGEVATDENGIALVRITYAKEFGNWLNVTLTARAAVQGTEFEESTDHALEITVADANTNQNPPGGLVSRFGGDPDHPSFPANLETTPDPTDPRVGDPRLVELGFPDGRSLGCRTLN